MKASVYYKYGPPEVLSIEEVQKPEAKADEVLIRVHASGVNRTDCGFRMAEYFAVRIFSGLFRPKIKILGTEFSGVIETVGENVTEFKPGDKIFGLRTFKFGTHAEYVAMKAHKTITTMPENMDFLQAACVLDGMMLGKNFIRNVDFSTPKKILINGASGSIGIACLQWAKYYGAEVTAIGNSRSLEILKALGADEVYPYENRDFTQTEQKYDFVFDTVGKSTFSKCKKILKPKGTYISSELGPGWQNVFLPLVTRPFGGKKVLFPIPTDSKKDILLFKKMIEEGKYQAVIDRTYSLDDIVEATKYVQGGEKTGNVVIKMD